MESSSGTTRGETPGLLARDLVARGGRALRRTWVVKVGTSALTRPDGTLDPARIDHLAEQISTVMDRGVESRIGQLGGGRRGNRQLGWDAGRILPQLQAAAAVAGRTDPGL